MVCSQLLLNAYVQRARLVELPAAVRPATPQEASECQARFVDILGSSTIGYKIAFTHALA